MDNLPRPEIQISEEKLHKFGLILASLALLFTVIGALVSPLDDQGKPVLLLPEVKAIEVYRLSARGWIADMAVLDGEIASGLSDEKVGDLFSQSRAAQQTIERAVALVQSVDRTKVPPVGMGLHDQLRLASQTYLEAARGALQWISTPDEKSKDQAVASLEAARGLRTALEANPWLTSP